MLRRRDPPLTRTQKLAQRSRRMRAMAASVKPCEGVVCGGTTSGVPIPKGQPAKPGKGAPTKQEASWMDGLIRYGCICCRMQGMGYVYPEIHHILRGGQRMGHLFTLPLCTNHHQGGAKFSSRHPWKERFTAAYGDEWALLSTLQGVLKLQSDGSYTP